MVDEEVKDAPAAEGDAPAANDGEDAKTDQTAAADQEQDAGGE